MVSLFLVYLAITISSWLVLSLFASLLDLMFFSGSVYQRGLHPGMPGYFSLVEFLTSWSGFLTAAGIITVIIAAVVIIFMVADWYQRNRDTDFGKIFISVVIMIAIFLVCTFLAEGLLIYSCGILSLGYKTFHWYFLFLTSWSGFFTVAGIIAGIESVVAIIFMVVDWYQRNRETDSGIMFINVVKFLGSSILYALITTVVLFALPLLLVFLWLLWPLAELLFGLDLTVLLSVFMTCEHCLLCYSLTIFVVSWAVACIYLTINSLYGGKEDDLTEGHNNNGTDSNNSGEGIRSADLLAFNPANVQGIQTHVDATADEAEDVGMMRAGINDGALIKAQNALGE